MVTVTPGCTATSDPVIVTITDTEPPTITACAAVRTLRGPRCQAPVPDMRSARHRNGQLHERSGTPGFAVPAPGTSVGLGVIPVSFSVFDASGNVTTCSSTLTVIDTTPPAIANPTASPSSLWPPDHKMATVTVDYGLSEQLQRGRCLIFFDLL